MDLCYPQHVSSKARDLVGRLLRKDPMDRISLQEVLEHPWIKPKN